MFFRLSIPGILLVTLLAWPQGARAGSCAPTVNPAARGTPREAGATAVHGLNLLALNRSVSPCKDFYDFADGGWIRSQAVSPLNPSWSLIDELRQNNHEILRRILEQEAGARAQAKRGSIDQKLGDFYASCMNTEAIDAAGWKPLAREFHRIERIGKRRELAPEVARLQKMGVGALFGFGEIRGYGNHAQVIATVYQGGLGLPGRAEYLQDGADFRQLREKYVLHVGRMFRLLGDSPGRARVEARTVLRIETRLARASMSRAEMRNPEATDHKMPRRRLQALTPHFSWRRYFRAIGLPKVGAINVSQPAYFRAMDRELASIPLADWKIYLRWQLVHAAAPDLSAPFVRENFDFYGRTLGGNEQAPPRWQSCLAATRRELPELLGRKYVEQRFTPSAKAAAIVLVRSLIATFRQDLRGVYWMSPQARAAAVAKLDKMAIQVGYPDRWRSDSAYYVSAGPFVENVFRGNRFHFQLDLAGIGKPFDHSLWQTSPSSVEVYYDMPTNEIVLPAGILQPPLFDPKADDALNYGGIGAIIGHEMTHGFDNEGSQFDADGNMKSWWTPEDRQGFHQLADCVADQYDTYVAVGNLHENGHLILDESIADIGGLEIAYNAFERTPEFRSHKKIQGFTPRQRFFLAYARIWAEKQDPSHIRAMVNMNPHAIGRFRVIGPLSDFEPFAQAFHCRGSDAMVRPLPDRCTVW